MAESEKVGSTDQVIEGAENGAKIPISREPSFVRLTADSTLVVDRGPDMEISLLIHERAPKHMTTDENRSFVELDGEFGMELNLVEIGKLRMLPPTAVNLAMNILHSNVQAGRLNLEGFRNSIDEMLEEAGEAEGSDPE